MLNPWMYDRKLAKRISTMMCHKNMNSLGKKTSVFLTSRKFSIESVMVCIDRVSRVTMMLLISLKYSARNMKASVKLCWVKDSSNMLITLKWAIRDLFGTSFSNLFSTIYTR